MTCAWQSTPEIVGFMQAQRTGGYPVAAPPTCALWKLRRRARVPGGRRSLVAVDDDLSGGRLRRPHLALAAVDLAYAGAAAARLEGLELLGRGVEAHHRLARPLGDPHLVGLVDVHRVDLRLLAGRLPRLPLIGLRV